MFPARMRPTASRGQACSHIPYAGEPDLPGYARVNLLLPWS